MKHSYAIRRRDDITFVQTLVKGEQLKKEAYVEAVGDV